MRAALQPWPHACVLALRRLTLDFLATYRQLISGLWLTAERLVQGRSGGSGPHAHAHDREVAEALVRFLASHATDVPSGAAVLRNALIVLLAGG